MYLNLNQTTRHFKNSVILILSLIIFSSCNGNNKCFDIDGNLYSTVSIGNQIWMAENLKVTHFRDGAEIPTGFINSDWVNQSNGAYTVYPSNNDDVSLRTCGENCYDYYGNIYNWYAVNDDRGICPDGYHIPSQDDWIDLTNYLSGEGADFLIGDLPINNLAGGLMKSTGTLEDNNGFWYKDNLSPLNGEGNNGSGFNAIPGGYRNCNRPNGGHYEWMGKVSYFWSSNEFVENKNMAWAQELWFHDHKIISFYHNKWTGFYVRCLKD